MGALLGGARGAGQAVTAPVAIAGVESSQRLRLNQLLNTSGKLGRSAGERRRGGRGREGEGGATDGSERTRPATACGAARCGTSSAVLLEQWRQLQQEYLRLVRSSPPCPASSQPVAPRLAINFTHPPTHPAGNSLGVLGLLFASFESFIGYMADGQIPEDANTLLAGAATGALYRSVRGPRQAVAAAAVGTIASSVLLAGRKFINPGL